MRPRRSAWKQIVARFGRGILRADRTIDRAALGRVVFADPAARRFLDRLIHPLVLADQERAARRQAHDRAEIAAHLHDSVLQTLALLQQAPEDPRQVASLARRQERELRGYIDQIASAFSPSLRAALRHAAGEVEDLFMVRIDTVVVGDCAADTPLESLVQASREAMVNAAKHSGVDRVALFAEVTAGGVTVTVRDRGRGFDPAAPAAGRGLAESVVGRMERCGGTAAVRSAPGEGTEIDLHLGRGHD